VLDGDGICIGREAPRSAQHLAPTGRHLVGFAERTGFVATQGRKEIVEIREATRLSSL
jgi:hypothetical protein